MTNSAKAVKSDLFMVASLAMNIGFCQLTGNSERFPHSLVQGDSILPDLRPRTKPRHIAETDKHASTNEGSYSKVKQRFLPRDG